MEQKRYGRENIKEGISDKLDSYYTKWSDQPMKNALKMQLMDYPREIEQNIIEWINNEELSEIDYHGISMKTIKDELKLSDVELCFLVLNFIRFKEENFIDIATCYGTFVLGDM